MYRTTVLVLGLIAAVTVSGGAVSAANSTPSGPVESPTSSATDPTAMIQFDNQTLVNSTVTIRSANLTDGGFVAVYNEHGVLLGATEYLDAGSHENVTVNVTQPLDSPDRDRERARNGSGGQIREQNQTRSTILVAMVHRDTNGNQSFDFVTSNETEDGPYVDDGIVLDDAYVNPQP